jgi:hypothetical protein
MSSLGGTFSLQSYDDLLPQDQHFVLSAWLIGGSDWFYSNPLPFSFPALNQLGKVPYALGISFICSEDSNYAGIPVLNSSVSACLRLSKPATTLPPALSHLSNSKAAAE